MTITERVTERLNKIRRRIARFFDEHPDALIGVGIGIGIMVGGIFLAATGFISLPTLGIVAAASILGGSLLSGIIGIIKRSCFSSELPPADDLQPSNPDKETLITMPQPTTSPTRTSLSNGMNNAGMSIALGVDLKQKAQEAKEQEMINAAEAAAAAREAEAEKTAAKAESKRQAAKKAEQQAKALAKEIITLLSQQPPATTRIYPPHLADEAEFFVRYKDGFTLMGFLKSRCPINENDYNLIDQKFEQFKLAVKGDLSDILSENEIAHEVDNETLTKKENDAKDEREARMGGLTFETLGAMKGQL